MSRESAAADASAPLPGYQSPEADARTIEANRLRARFDATADHDMARDAFDEALRRWELGTAERIVLQLESLQRGVAAGLVDEEDGAPVDELPPDSVYAPLPRDVDSYATPDDLRELGRQSDPFALWREETGDPALAGDGSNALTLVPRERLAAGLDMVLVAVHSYFPPVKPGTKGYPEPLVVAQGHELGGRGELGPHVNVKLTSYPHAALAKEAAAAGVRWVDAARPAWFDGLPSARSGELGTFWPVGPAGPCVFLLSIRYEGKGERADVYRVRVRGCHPLATARGLARRDPSWRGFPARLPSEGVAPPRPPRAPTPPPAEPADLTGERPANRRPPAKGPAPKRAAPKRAPKGRGK